MSDLEQPTVESGNLSDFAKVMKVNSDPVLSSSVSKLTQVGRLNVKEDNVKNGLGQLVLTLIKLLHEVLERQAIRRIDAGSLNDEEIERLGVTLMKQAEEIERLRKEFGLEEEDLNIDLGPLGKVL
jgi:hypothetical protein